ncbi:MAG: septum formation family protein [Limisphaerales bacterium]
MIFYGSDGRLVNLGFVEERQCDTCGKVQPFGLTLAYKYIHVYWAFRWVVKRQYWLTCPVCQKGWELERQKVEAGFSKSPVPLWDRYGLAALVLAVALGIAYIISLEADRGGDGTIATAGSLGAFQIRVGDCYNDDGPLSATDQAEITEVSSVPAVPCSEPHDNEVFALLPASLTNYPGRQEMADLSDAMCLERFEDFVGRDYDSSSLAIATIHPTEESWRERNDREVVCAVFHMERRKLSGTMRNSNF